MKNNEQLIIECVAESLMIETKTISSDSRLINDLGMDSVDFLDIMFQIESRFGITLQKEDLNFLSRIGMTQEEAVKDGFLSSEAKNRLHQILPDMPLDCDIKLLELGDFITIGTLLKIIEDIKAKSDKYHAR